MGEGSQEGEQGSQAEGQLWQEGGGRARLGPRIGGGRCHQAWLSAGSGGGRNWCAWLSSGRGRDKRRGLNTGCGRGRG